MIYDVVGGIDSSIQYSTGVQGRLRAFSQLRPLGNAGGLILRGMVDIQVNVGCCDYIIISQYFVTNAFAPGSYLSLIYNPRQK